jgi:hypothetical protein
MAATETGAGTDLEKVDRVIEIVDLVADANDADPEAVLQASLSRVRRREYETEVNDARQTDS